MAGERVPVWQSMRGALKSAFLAGACVLATNPPLFAQTDRTCVPIAERTGGTLDGAKQ